MREHAVWRGLYYAGAPALKTLLVSPAGVASWSRSGAKSLSSRETGIASGTISEEKAYLPGGVVLLYALLVWGLSLDSLVF